MSVWLSEINDDGGIEALRLEGMQYPAVKPQKDFFDGIFSAIPSGIKTGVAKSAMPLLGSKQKNINAAKDSKLQRDLFELKKSKGQIDKNLSFEDYISSSYEKGVKSFLTYIEDNKSDGGTGAQIAHGVADFGTRAMVGIIGTKGTGLGAKAATIGASANTGISSYTYTKEDLKSKGVDAETAHNAGLVQGATDGISTAIPLSFGFKGAPKGVIKDGVVSVGAATGVSQGGQVLTHSTLESEGYDKQAKQYEFSGQGLAVDLALNALMFGGSRGLSHYQENGTPDFLKYDPNIAEFKLPVFETEVSDAAIDAGIAKKHGIEDTLALNEIEFDNAVRPDLANDQVVQNRHYQNIDTAIDQILAIDKTPVNVPHNLTPPKGEFVDLSKSKLSPQLAPSRASSGDNIFSLISKGESSGSVAKSYQVYNRGKAGDSTGKTIDFSKMTVGQVMAGQSGSRRSRQFFAIGRWQIIPSTLKGAVAALGIDRNAKFTPELQDHIFKNYLVKGKRPQIYAYVTGKNSNVDAAVMAMAQEFASVGVPHSTTNKGRPVAKDQSFHKGTGNNAASISSGKVKAALKIQRNKYQQAKASGMSDQQAWQASFDGGSSVDYSVGQIQTVRNFSEFAEYNGRSPLYDDFGNPRYESGTAYPRDNIFDFYKNQVAFTSPKDGTKMPDVVFQAGHIDDVAAEGLKQYLPGFNDELRDLRLSGQTIKHIYDSRPEIAPEMVQAITGGDLRPSEILPNPQRPDRALLIYDDLRPNSRKSKDGLMVVEVAANGRATDMVSFMTAKKPYLDKARKYRDDLKRNEPVLDGRQPLQEGSHHISSSQKDKGRIGQAHFPEVNTSSNNNITSNANNSSGQTNNITKEKANNSATGRSPGEQTIAEIVAANPDQPVSVPRIRPDGEIEEITMTVQELLDEIKQLEAKTDDDIKAAQAAISCAMRFGE